MKVQLTFIENVNQTIEVVVSVLGFLGEGIERFYSCMEGYERGGPNMNK